MAQGSSGRSTRGAKTSDTTSDTASDSAAAGTETGGEVVEQNPVAGPGTAVETDESAPERTEQPDGAAPGTESGTRYLNTSGGPLPYDEDGHVVADGEWTPPVNLDPIGRHQRDRGFLQSRTALGLT